MWMRRSPLGATCARTERGGAGLTRRRGVIHTELEPLFVNCARRRDKQFSGFHLETRHPGQVRITRDIPVSKT